MPKYGHAAHDTYALKAMAGKRERMMRIKELFTLETSYTAWAGTGQRAFYGVYSSRLLISYLQSRRRSFATAVSHLYYTPLFEGCAQMFQR